MYCNFRYIPSALLFLCTGKVSAFAVDCPSCGQSYPDFIRLAFHCASKHDILQCSQCSEGSFSNREDCDRHQLEKHGKVLSFCVGKGNRIMIRCECEYGWQHDCKKGDAHAFATDIPSPCSGVSSEIPIPAEVRADPMGSFLDFLCAVRPRLECCTPFRDAILFCSKERLLKNIREFSKHVLMCHNMCFFCERATDRDMFDREHVGNVNIFLRPEGYSGIFPKEIHPTCFCGKKAQRNAVSQLFVLDSETVGQIPGTGFDKTAHPFLCAFDTNEDRNAMYAELHQRLEAIVSGKFDDANDISSEQQKTASAKSEKHSSVREKQPMQLSRCANNNKTFSPFDTPVDDS